VPAPARNRVDLIFRAFADPVRLRILNLIQEGELCVCDLVDTLKLPQPTVSRHLSYLRKAGLVRVRQERSWNFYELAPARSTFHAKMLECLASCYSDVPEMRQDRSRSQKIRSKGGSCPA
jgi:ArsR family transcriptional regulator